MEFVSKHIRKIIIVQVILLLVLLAIIVVKTNKIKIYNIDISKFTSDYIRYDYENQYWGVADKQIGEAVDVTLLSREGMHLKRGSYTITVKYATDKQQNLYLGQTNPNASFVHANTFYLSKNKNEALYDFYVTDDVEDFKIEVVNYKGGNFFLTGIQISENTNSLKTVWFVTLFVFVIIDLIWVAKKRKSNNGILILAVIALIPTLILFMPGLGVNQDYAFHFHRIESIAQGLKNHEFPVKMYSTYNDGYGYPVGVFYGDLLLYLPAILRVVGFSITFSYKCYVYIVNLLSALTMYMLVGSIVKNNRLAYASVLVYLTCGYRLMDIYVRYAVGEYTALIFYPLIIQAVWRMYSMDDECNHRYDYLFLAGGMTGLIYTHVLSVEIICLFLFVIAILFLKKTFTVKTCLTYLKAIIASMLMSLGFIVPFIDYWINAETTISSSVNGAKLIQKQGAYITDFFSLYRNYYGRSNVDVTEHMCFTPGIILIISLVVGIYLIYKEKASKYTKKMVVTSVLLLWISSAYFPWNMLASNSRIFNIVATIQFPWRFLSLGIIALTILFALVVNDIEKINFNVDQTINISFVVSLLSMCMFISWSTSMVKTIEYIDTEELPYYTYSFNFGEDALGADEYLITGTDIQMLTNGIQAYNIDAELVYDTGTKLCIYVSENSGGYIDFPRFDYPHYIVYDDAGQAIETSRGDNNRLRINIDNYTGNIYVEFKEPVIWRVSELMSLITVLSLLGYYLYQNNKRKEK